MGDSERITPPWWLKPMKDGPVVLTVPGRKSGKPWSTLITPFTVTLTQARRVRGAGGPVRGVPIRPGIMTRVLVATMLGAALFNCAPAHADPFCLEDGIPPDSATRAYDGGTVWISPDGLVGVTTDGGSGRVRVPSASPMPLQALVIDAQGNGERQLIVSNGREAHLFVLAGCKISAAYDGQGNQFVFDLENLRGTGTGVGCADLGDGRHLVGLQALPDGGGYTVRRTEINLDGFIATIGLSDTVTGTSAQDPVVASAMTISCGDQTMAQNGVQQP
jgi:hypothetical protein